MIIHIRPDIVEIRTPTYHIRTQFVRKRHMAIMGEDQDIVYDEPEPWPEELTFDNTPLYWERSGSTSQILHGDFLLVAYYFEHNVSGTHNIPPPYSAFTELPNVEYSEGSTVEEITTHAAFTEFPEYEETGGTEDVDIELDD